VSAKNSPGTLAERDVRNVVVRIRDLDWTGDPEPYLALLPAYGERPDALVEE